MMNAIKTTHNLDFKATPWHRNPKIMLFKIGTCHGQYYNTELTWNVISITNDHPGNGHLDDFFQWFEYACKRDDRIFVIEEFLNERFRQHCIDKRGFIAIPGTNNVAKA